MSRCVFAEECKFFQTNTGYSPELYEQMRTTYCLGDQGDCWRKKARETVSLDRIPDEMLPTDREVFERICAPPARGSLRL